MTTRRNFLSLLACIPGLSWLNPKPAESIDHMMSVSWGFIPEPKCYQMVQWISVDFETPPLRKEERVGEHAQLVKFNGKPEIISFSKRSIGVLVYSEEHGVEVGRRVHFCNCDPTWFVGGFERKVTHWALYPAGPHEAYVSDESDPREVYENALNLFLGPIVRKP